MYSADSLFEAIRRHKSFLCVGLDPDPVRIPANLTKDVAGVRQFLGDIIQATTEYCIAYKPNFAFFEALGPQGTALLREVISLIPDTHLVIGDAKRGDIGNTAAMYARAVFDEMGCDAVTVSPYMGLDTLEPFLTHKDKWTIVLILTSNPGSADFQRQTLVSGEPLWERVLSDCVADKTAGQMMFVVGGTHAHDFRRVRELAPESFLLVPGFGAQQGSLREVAHYGFNERCGILANVSRSILYASAGVDYAAAAAQVARQYQEEMVGLLVEYGLVGQ